jgi:hypothetical protein
VKFPVIATVTVTVTTLGIGTAEITTRRLSLGSVITTEIETTTVVRLLSTASDRSMRNLSGLSSTKCKTPAAMPGFLFWKSSLIFVANAAQHPSSFRDAPLGADPESIPPSVYGLLKEHNPQWIDLYPQIST